jgi:ribosomal protein S2
MIKGNSSMFNKLDYYTLKDNQYICNGCNSMKSCANMLLIITMVVIKKVVVEANQAGIKVIDAIVLMS